MYKSATGQIKAAYAALAPDDLLPMPITTLLGVTAEAARVLQTFGLTSIFDLASSRLFGTAHDVGSAATGSSSVAPLRVVPSDMIDAAERGRSAAELAAADVSVLRLIGPSNRDALVTALNVATVQDLGNWPPYQAARGILNEAYGLPPSGVTDPDAPPELLPVGRRYATETRRYPKLFFDQIVTGAGLELRDLADSSQLDVSDVDVERGFTRPATGALLIFEQLWIPEGLSLGQLASSVALAPGESTKIAVVDWARRVASSVSESIEEQDRLAASLSQTRAISEIQDSVANEHTWGESSQETTSTTTASGTSSGGGVEGILGGAVELYRSINPVMSIIDGITGRKRREPKGSTNTSESTTTGSSMSVSSSSGDRSVSAMTQQDIKASTQQASSSVRSRRASAVQEVTQTESEQMRTRVVANYNHSHALSIHYYEVVQIYRTLLRLAKWDRVLFVPMKPLDLANPLVIARHKQALLRAVGDAWVRGQLGAFAGKIIFHQINTGGPSSQTFEFDGDLEIRFAAAQHRSGRRRSISLVFTRRHEEDVTVPVEFGVGTVRLPENLLLGAIQSVSIRHGAYPPGEPAIVRLSLILAQPGATKVSGAMTFDAVLQPEQDATECLRATTPDVDPTVFDYLREHALDLSQQIWGSLSQRDLALLLSRYAFRGEPLVEVIDLEILTVFGNYIAFPYHPRHDDDPAWKAWQEQHLSKTTVDEDLVPVPTEGMFAEAVLGRFNASEKLDITRFWDWQESPIPLQAPDIGPLQAGQHQAASVVTPGHLSTPVLGMQAPMALPQPTGLGPMLNTLQADLFRDMSGLAETAATLRESTDTTGEASQNAAHLANEIERIKQETIGRLTEMVARAGIAAAGAAVGGPAGTAIGGSVGGVLGGGGSQWGSLSPQAGATNAQRGAMLNYGESSDRERPRGTSANAMTGGTSTESRDRTRSALGDESSSGGGRFRTRDAPMSREDQAFNSIVSDYAGSPAGQASGDVVPVGNTPVAVTRQERWGSVHFDRGSDEVDTAGVEYRDLLARVIFELQGFNRRRAGSEPALLLVRGLASRDRRNASFDNVALSGRRARSLAAVLARDLANAANVGEVTIAAVAGGIGGETDESEYPKDRRADVVLVFKNLEFKWDIGRPRPSDEAIRAIVVERIRSGDPLMIQAEQEASLNLIGDSALSETEGMLGPTTVVGQAVSLALTLITQGNIFVNPDEIEMRQYRRIYDRYQELRGSSDTF